MTLEKQIWIWVVHSRTRKIVMYTRGPRFRASLRHGRQGFFELFVPDPPRGRPFAGGGDHRTWRSMKKISYHTRIVQFSGKRSITATRSWGFYQVLDSSPEPQNHEEQNSAGNDWITSRFLFCGERKSWMYWHFVHTWGDTPFLSSWNFFSSIFIIFFLKK